MATTAAPTTLAPCSAPPTISGGTIVTSGPYNSGSIAVYQCSSNYAMSGSPYINCNDGVWDTSPSCLLSDGTDVSLTSTVNEAEDASIPDWLLYVLATVLGLLGLMILVFIVACCLHMCGFTGGCYFGRHMRQDGTQELGPTFCDSCYYCCCCCCHKRNSYRSQSRVTNTTHTSKNPTTQKPKMAFADVGQRVVEVNRETREAKKVDLWLPHSNPVREINTSTK